MFSVPGMGGWDDDDDDDDDGDLAGAGGAGGQQQTSSGQESKKKKKKKPKPKASAASTTSSSSSLTSLSKELSAQSGRLMNALGKETDSVFHSPGFTRNLLDKDLQPNQSLSQGDEKVTPTKRKKNKKKNKKTKQNGKEGEEEEEERPRSGSAEALKRTLKRTASSTSSLVDEAVEAVGNKVGQVGSKVSQAGTKVGHKVGQAGSKVGHLLKGGIRFNSADDFVEFVDTEGEGEEEEKSNKKKKKKRKREEGEEREKEKTARAPASKRQRTGSDEASGQRGGETFDREKLKDILGLNEEEYQAARMSATSSSNSSNKALLALKTSRFRYLNEQLYTQPGAHSYKMFQKDGEAFRVYHQGYQEQAKKWPVDPVQVIAAAILKRSGQLSIADMGCGEARLARLLPPSCTVYSFDLVALNERVTACDMARTPLKDGTVDMVVFCLSLMGTNLRDYLKEANRILKAGGTLKVAEVESRFRDVAVDDFVQAVSKFGFGLKWKDTQQNYFVFVDFKKTSACKRKLPEVALKPCFYKKR